MTEARKVVVLKGGRSAEREVSLNTGSQVAEALRSDGFDVIEIDSGDSNFIEQLRNASPDVVFIALHGRFGEDGTVQGLLELLDMRYVGSGVLSSALAMDKAMSKHVFTQAGLPTPPYVHLRSGDDWNVEAIALELGHKTVVKPSSEGSAIGVTIVHDPSELERGIIEAFRHDSSVLVEAFIPGVELTVGVLGTDDPFALPTIEIVPQHEFYDYDSKYVPGMSKHLIPARVTDAQNADCQRLALDAHHALGCRGMSRADFIISEDGEVWLLEVNTIPGMTSTSLLPDAARAAGIEFPSLCRLLVEGALED